MFHKFALVIGVGRYDDPRVPYLPSASRGAKAVGKVLDELNFVVSLLVDDSPPRQQPTKRNIVTTLSSLRKYEMPPNGTLLIYLSGRVADGDPGQSPAILPRDADATLQFNTLLPLKDLCDLGGEVEEAGGSFFFLGDLSSFDSVWPPKAAPTMLHRSGVNQVWVRSSETHHGGMIAPLCEALEGEQAINGCVTAATIYEHLGKFVVAMPDVSVPNGPPATILSERLLYDAERRGSLLELQQSAECFYNLLCRMRIPYDCYVDEKVRSHMEGLMDLLRAKRLDLPDWTYRFVTGGISFMAPQVRTDLLSADIVGMRQDLTELIGSPVEFHLHMASGRIVVPDVSSALTKRISRMSRAGQIPTLGGLTITSLQHYVILSVRSSIEVYLTTQQLFCGNQLCVPEEFWVEEVCEQARTLEAASQLGKQNEVEPIYTALDLWGREPVPESVSLVTPENPVLPKPMDTGLLGAPNAAMDGSTDDADTDNVGGEKKKKKKKDKAKAAPQQEGGGGDGILSPPVLDASSYLSAPEQPYDTSTDEHSGKEDGKKKKKKNKKHEGSSDPEAETGPEEGDKKKKKDKKGKDKKAKGDASGELVPAVVEDGKETSVEDSPKKGKDKGKKEKKDKKEKKEKKDKSASGQGDGLVPDSLMVPDITMDTSTDIDVEGDGPKQKKKKKKKHAQSDVGDASSDQDTESAVAKKKSKSKGKSKSHPEPGAGVLLEAPEMPYDTSTDEAPEEGDKKSKKDKKNKDKKKSKKNTAEEEPPPLELETSPPPAEIVDATPPLGPTELLAPPQMLCETSTDEAREDGDKKDKKDKKYKDKKKSKKGTAEEVPPVLELEPPLASPPPEETMDAAPPLGPTELLAPPPMLCDTSTDEAPDAGHKKREKGTKKTKENKKEKKGKADTAQESSAIEGEGDEGVQGVEEGVAIAPSAAGDEPDGSAVENTEEGTDLVGKKKKEKGEKKEKKEKKEESEKKDKEKKEKKEKVKKVKEG